MNVSLSNSSNLCILSPPSNSIAFPSPISAVSSGTAESPILLNSSSSTDSPMTTGSLFQQLSNASSLINPVAAAAAVSRLLPTTSNSIAASLSLFTVEQLELIRRLRMTGISGDAVLEAFNTLEKIESDLDTNRIQSMALAALMGNSNSSNQTKLFDGMPSSVDQILSHQPPPQLIPQLSSTSPPTLLQQLSSQAFGVNLSSNSSMPSLSTPQQHQHQQHQQSTANTIITANMSESSSKESPSLSPESTTLCPLPFSSSSTGGGDLTLSFGNYASSIHPSATSTPSTSSSSVSRPIRSQRTPMKEITTLDDPSELEDFMLQGEEGCINDMKQFITQFSLRQTTVAMMTGVSQPYISKLLNGNHKELSLRCRKNIYSWYLNCRRHPEKLASFLQDPSTRLETNGDGELVPQRRERYVFRPILIKILETFFAETPFPDYNKRAEIASACNSALQMDKKGVGLMPKEIVSPQVVANWFANKRKEMRRRSNEDPMPSSHQLVQQNSENGDDPSLTSTPSPLTPMDSASSLMEAENSGGDFFGQFSNPFKAAFLNSAFQSKNDSMLMDSADSPPPSLPPTLSTSANFDVLMQSGLFNNLIGAYQQQQQQHQQHQQHLQQLHHHHHQLPQPQQSQQSNNNNNIFVKMEQTAE